MGNLCVSSVQKVSVHTNSEVTNAVGFRVTRLIYLAGRTSNRAERLGNQPSTLVFDQFVFPRAFRVSERSMLGFYFNARAASKGGLCSFAQTYKRGDRIQPI